MTAWRFPVVGICGRARSGKDTVAAMLLEMGVVKYRYALADPIRLMLHAGLGIDLSAPEWAERKEQVIPELGRSPRQLLQTLGTEWGRHLVHQDVWLLQAAEALATLGPGMVISDVRFQNEADWVIRRGGALINVMAERAADVAPHASEAGVILKLGRDAFILNDGTLDDLRKSVELAWAALTTRALHGTNSPGASETGVRERSGRT